MDLELSWVSFLNLWGRDFLIHSFWGSNLISACEPQSHGELLAVLVMRHPETESLCLCECESLKSKS